MEQPAQKPAQAQLRPLSGVAYSVQAFDWSGGECRGKGRDSGQQIMALALPVAAREVFLFRERERGKSDGTNDGRTE